MFAGWILRERTFDFPPCAPRIRQNATSDLTALPRRLAMNALRASPEDFVQAIPPGVWRYAAIACLFVALAAAVVAIAAPAAAGWPGVFLVTGIGFVAGLFLWALRTR